MHCDPLPASAVTDEREPQIKRGGGGRSGPFGPRKSETCALECPGSLGRFFPSTCSLISSYVNLRLWPFFCGGGMRAFRSRCGHMLQSLAAVSAARAIASHNSSGMLYSCLVLQLSCERLPPPFALFAPRWADIGCTPWTKTWMHGEALQQTGRGLNTSPKPSECYRQVGFLYAKPYLQ